MVDRLRQAADLLEAPICPKCLIEMSWFRSELVRVKPTSLIVQADSATRHDHFESERLIRVTTESHCRSSAAG